MVERAPATKARPTGSPDLKWVPREHGASFMSIHALLLGIVAGIVAGGRSWTGLLVALVIGALVLPISGSVSVWSHPKLGARAKRRAAALGALLAGLGVLALMHGPAAQLLMVAAAGAALSGGYTLARVTRGPRSTPAELAAIASLCVLAPLAWLLIAGTTGAWMLSAPAAFLAFGVSVPYVQERVRRRRLKDTTLGERLRGGAVCLAWQTGAVVVTVALSVAGAVTPLVAVAFLPGAVKTWIAIARPESRPPLKKIGYLETALSTLFAVLAGIGLGLS